MSAVARTLPTPKSRSMSRRVEERPVELLELADGVGDGEQPPGFAGTVEVLSSRSADGPAGGGVDGVRAGDVGQDVALPSDAPLWPAWAGCAPGLASGPAAEGSGPGGGTRLDVGTGRGRGGLDAGGAGRATEGHDGARRCRAADLRARPAAPGPRRAFRDRGRPGGRPLESRPNAADGRGCSVVRPDSRGGAVADIRHGPFAVRGFNPVTRRTRRGPLTAIPIRPEWAVTCCGAGRSSTEP